MPLPHDMGAVQQQRALRQDALKLGLAFEQGLAAQILAVEIEQIEHAIEEPRRLPLGVLQQLEARTPLLIQRHKLAVEHGLLLDRGEGRTDRGIFARDVVAVAGIERGMTRRGDGNGAEAVPLGLEHPGGVVERLVSEGGEHGAKIGSHPGTVGVQLACAAWCPR